MFYFIHGQTAATGICGRIVSVTLRGDRREAIYRDTKDREDALEALGQVCTRFNWIVHAFG